MNQLRCLLLITVVLIGCKKNQQLPERPKIEPEIVVASGEGAKESIVKDIVVLSPSAAREVRKIIRENESKYLRVSVSDDLEYKLDLDNRTDAVDDYLGESRNVPIVVDRKSSLYIPTGMIVDFIDEIGTRGFKCKSPEFNSPPDTSISLAEARRGFKTTLARHQSAKYVAPEPPAKLFRIVHYDSSPGKMVAYLTPDPKDGKKHPAIIWITGGDCNSIDEGSWNDSVPAIDQSASAYRKVGMVMMFPALRGGNDNPGVKEGFFGEVDDVLAAAEYLSKQEFVDPDRIYLGGHSTGGTLALLVAECSDRFRAVFSFGPTDDILSYGPKRNTFVASDAKELQLRSPNRWLHSIKSPVFVIEGSGGNASALQSLARNSKNPKLQFLEINGAEHFGVLAPTNKIIAEKVLRDTGPKCSVEITLEELNKAFKK